MMKTSGKTYMEKMKSLKNNLSLLNLEHVIRCLGHILI